jgi:hypothetical protein
MACAVKKLDMGGIGAGNPQLRRLKKPNFAVRCPMRANKVTNGTPFPKYFFN